MSHVNSFEANIEEELFCGMDPHRFVPLNSTVAKQIKVSVPMGVYGGIKKDEMSYLNSTKNSTPMIMELVPAQNFIKSEKSRLVKDTRDENLMDKSKIKEETNEETNRFDTIKEHYYDSKYLPTQYLHEDMLVKKVLNNYNGEITMKVLINQASGIMSEKVAKNCRATGIGLKKAVAGEITQLMIHSYSEDNKRITYGGYSFKLLLTPYKYLTGEYYQEQFSINSLEFLDIDQAFEGNVTDNNDGTYTGSYICKRAAPHKLEIIESRNKSSIGESPFVVHVYPGKAYPQLCWAEGEGLENYNVDETISSFKIYSVDRMGNKIKSGGDKYEIYGIGGIKIQQILDLKNGEYEVYYKVHNCNLDHYKEINIKLYGQDIKTPAFYPKPKILNNDKLNRLNEKNLEENLINKTVLKFDNLSIDFKPAYTLSMVFENFEEMKKMGNEINITVPNLVPFPENKEKQNFKEIIQRVKNINGLEDIEINDEMVLNEKIRSNTLEYYRKNILKHITNKLLKHEDILNGLSKAIIMHCEKGKEHDEKLIKDEKKLESELGEITDCQQRMFATYSCLQQGGIDSLPVSFELEDPEKVKSRQLKDRKFYVDTYNILEKKFEEIKLRKEIFEKNRDDYTHKLHRTLATRQRSIIKAQRSYNKILDELDKVYLQLSKKQLRRQDLYNNLRPESLQVFESIENQKIIDKQLKKNMVIVTNSRTEDDQNLDQVDSDSSFRRIIGKDRRYNNYSCLIPTDPESPAFWFAEASYLRDEKDKNNSYKKHNKDINLNDKSNDYSQKVKRWDLDEDSRWISCPSSVSITFSTMKTPEIQPIKQKGIFKNDYNSKNKNEVQKEVAIFKKRDPMLPDGMLDDEMNEIIQKERENKKFLNKKYDNLHSEKNIYTDINISQWVKNPPKPSDMKSFYNKSLDLMNRQLFNDNQNNEEILKKQKNINKMNMESNIEDYEDIDINLINKEIRLLPDRFWDKEFMLDLNKNAKKSQDFDKIKNIWRSELSKGRELKQKVYEERIKFMKLLPDKELKEQKLDVMREDDHELEEHENINIIKEKSNDDSSNDFNKYVTDLDWKYLHHTFESDPRRVPWEFLDEISRLETIPDRELSKKDLQKYIVESLVMDENHLNKKVISSNMKFIQENTSKTNAIEKSEKKTKSQSNIVKKNKFYLMIKMV